MSGITSLVQAAGVIEHKMEAVSNNLANVNTVGFKEDQPSFREVLSNVQRIAPESLEERFLSHEYLDDYVGMDKSAVVVDEIGKNFEPGRMRSTGNNLDFAISNEGFSQFLLLRVSVLHGPAIFNSIRQVVLSQMTVTRFWGKMA